MPRFIPSAALRLHASGALRLCASAALICAAAACDAGADDGARLIVTDRAVTAPLEPIGATMGAVGAGAQLLPGGGFEPVIYRTRITARADSPDRIVAPPNVITDYDSLREGALDGAEVQILRIENGRLRTVREDRVAEGGFRASGWREVLPGRRAIPPRDTEVDPYWEPWYRPDAPTWFMLRAVSADGALSPPSAAVEIRSGAAGKARRGARKELTETLIDFRADLHEADPRAPAAPQGLKVARGPDGDPVLRWSPPAGGGVAGYLLYRSETPPRTHKGYEIVLEGGAAKPPIREGDMAILRTEFRQISRNRLHSDRVWGAFPGRKYRPRLIDDFPDETLGVTWTLRDHAPGAPVEDGGRSYLEISLAHGKSMAVGRPNHAGRDQDYYDVLEVKPYRIEVWLRSDAPGRATFRFAGGGNSYRGDIAPITFVTGPEWRRYTADVTPPRVLDSGVGRMEIAFQGPNTYGIDNFRAHPAETAFLDLPARDYARLKGSGFQTLRIHSFIKSKEGTYDLAELTNGAGATNSMSGGNTLPQSLGIVARAGMNPWIQVEPHFSDAEWLGLVEYLAAPADAGPWAAKRAAQGRAAPWTDAFDTIEFEMGNETWNQIFQPWTFDPMTDAVTGDAFSAGEVYGLFHERVAQLMKSSPWWTPALDAKLRFVLGGWSINSYGEQAARHSPSAELMTVGSYIGGWDENQGPPARTPPSYFNVLNQVSQVTIPRAERHAETVAKIAGRQGAPLFAGTYEAGPGYAHPRLPGGKGMTPQQEAEQEEVMKSQAAGVATLDSFLAQARAGYRVQNYFSFSEGARWASHAFSRDGGQAYPSWKLISLLNREGLGEMLDIRADDLPAADLERFKGRPAVEDAPLVSAYALRDGDRINLFLISRRVPGVLRDGDDGCTPLTVSLPFAKAGRVTLHRMAGAYDAHNIKSDAAKIEVLDIAPPADPAAFGIDARAGAAECGLPPASAFLYVFEETR